MHRLLPLLALLLVVAPAVAQDLGETQFANSGAPEAQEPFLRGVLLLHSFEYDDAREAFREAQAIDPTFVMAYWGEAMTHNHPVWQRQDRDAALEALGRLEAQDGVEMTPRERDYLRTLSFLFGDGEKEDRDDDYAVAMETLAREYADDLDARAFYALALLGTAHEGRDFATYMRSAAVAEEVFDENPRHPGAAHYLIHAYDDPVHAPLGLRPARAYAEIAPSASHALHMPSHIYLALGMWPEVEAMNRRSFEAAKAGTDRRGVTLNGHGWHALWWRHYAALQLDDRPLADGLLALAISLADEDPEGGTALAHAGMIRAQHYVDTRDASALTVTDPDAEAGNYFDGFVHVIHLLRERDLVGARRAVETYRGLIDTDSWRWQASLGTLEGLLLAAEGDTDGADAAFREAARVESEAPLTFGPPTPAIMANEAFGQFLLNQGRFDEAAEAFRAALDRAPNRQSAVRGLRVATEPPAPEPPRDRAGSRD